MAHALSTRILAAALTAVAGMSGQIALASNTVVVGPSTCQPALTHYATIQAAVNAAPNAGIVLVCPGTYPEQVSISKPLTLKGVTDGTSNAAIITVPGGGLVPNATQPTYFGGPVSGQVVVQNTSGVTVSNLTIDGTGGGCLYPTAIRQGGVVAYNVGNTIISNTTVRHQVTSCQTGEGILADTSSITISSNLIHDIDRTAIFVAAGVGTVQNNNVERSAIYGIALYLGNKGVVSGNTVTNVFAFNLESAILLQATSNSIVSKNVLLSSPASYIIGIWAYQGSSGNTIVSNSVSDFGYGIVLQGASNTVVQTNKLSELFYDGIYEDTSLGGNNITKNTVNEATYGIFTDSSVGGDTLVPNTFYNTVTTIDPTPPSVADSPQPM